MKSNKITDTDEISITTDMKVFNGGMLLKSIERKSNLKKASTNNEKKQSYPKNLNDIQHISETNNEQNDQIQLDENNFFEAEGIISFRTKNNQPETNQNLVNVIKNIEKNIKNNDKLENNNEETNIKTIFKLNEEKIETEKLMKNFDKNLARKSNGNSFSSNENPENFETEEGLKKMSLKDFRKKNKNKNFSKEKKNNENKILIEYYSSEDEEIENEEFEDNNNLFWNLKNNNNGGDFHLKKSKSFTEKNFITGKYLIYFI